DTALSHPPPRRVKVASTNGDESSNLELIAQNFFAEKEDVESLNVVRFQSEEVAKTEMIDFSELSQIKIGEVNDSALEFYFNKFRENFENHECFILYSKSNYVARSSFPLNDTRSLFDRGKCGFISLNYSEKMFIVWISIFGYQSYFRSRHLIVSLSVDNDTIFDERKLFVRISKRRLARIVEIDETRAPWDVFDEGVVWRSNGADGIFSKLQLSLPHALRVFMRTVHYNLFVDVCLFLNFDSHRSVFDRGKDINLILWICYIAKLGFQFGYRIKVWVTNSIIFVLAKHSKLFMLDAICFKWPLCVPSYTCLHISGSVFDRGKVFKTITRYFYSVTRIYYSWVILQLQASPCHVLFFLDTSGVCSVQLLKEVFASALGGYIKSGFNGKLLEMVLAQLCGLVYRTLEDHSRTKSLSQAVEFHISTTEDNSPIAI
ncbi:hypothetical protein MKX03_018377, partial [Papaver bracteatum]